MTPRIRTPHLVLVVALAALSTPALARPTTPCDELPGCPTRMLEVDDSKQELQKDPELPPDSTGSYPCRDVRAVNGICSSDG